MKPVSIILLAAGLAFVSVGCKEEDDLKVSVNATEKNICSQYADVMCKNIFECCTGAEIEENFGVKITTDEGECRRDMELVCEHNASEYLYAFENGTAVIVKESMDKCLEEMLVMDGECFPFKERSAMMPSCDEELVMGQVAAEGSCLFSFECTGDAYCDVDRKCKNYPTLGQPCDDYGCATGLYCGYDVDADELQCKARITTGNGCSDAMLCVEELYCFPIPEDEIDYAADPVITGTCGEKRALGVTCAANPECETGNCLPGVCGDGSECYDDDQCWGTCSTSGDECQTADDCDGVCNGGNNDGNGCFNNGDCEGYCENSFDTCNVDGDCGSFCDVTGDACDTLADCDAVLDAACVADTCTGGGVCESAQTCEKAPCAGEHTCVENYGTMDYCSAGANVPIWEPELPADF